MILQLIMGGASFLVGIVAFWMFADGYAKYKRETNWLKRPDKLELGMEILLGVVGIALAIMWVMVIP